eukprot:357190-Chlamydomonas_euryale.AAC.3
MAVLSHAISSGADETGHAISSGADETGHAICLQSPSAQTARGDLRTHARWGAPETAQGGQPPAATHQQGIRYLNVHTFMYGLHAYARMHAWPATKPTSGFFRAFCAT